MFAIDTNLLVYAHNTDSEFHEKASLFLERNMNERNKEGLLEICLPVQVLTEFINVITRQRIRKLLSVSEAAAIVQDYIESGVTVVHQKETQIYTLLNIFKTVTTRKKTFDVALAATLKDNNIEGLYTVNFDDFKEFDFLKVINPLMDAPANACAG